MSTSYKVGSAPWERQSYPVGSAPWESPISVGAPVDQPQGLYSKVWNSIIDTAASGMRQTRAGLDAAITAGDVTPQESSDLYSAYRGGGMLSAVPQLLATASRKGVNAVKGLGDAVGGLFGTALAPILGPANLIGQRIGNTIGGSIPDPVAISLERAANNQIVAQTSSDVLSLLNLAFPDIAKRGADMLSTADSSIKNSFTPDVVKDPNIAIADAFRDVANRYSKTSAILDMAENVHNTDPVGVLASYGKNIIPALDNGKITSAAVSDVNSTLKQGIKFLSNLKSDALFLDDTVIPYDQYRQFVSDTLEAEAARASWPAAYLNKVKTQVDSILSERASSYDSGLSVSEIDKLKTADTSLSRSYRNTDKFQYDGYGILGKANRGLVDMLSDAPVRELNKLIQSHYDAIDLVDSLLGRTPHGGRLTALAERAGGGAVGALLGANAGHPFIGYVGGRVAGGVIDSLFSSNFISNPLKRLIINGAEIKDPAVVANIRKYIDANMPDITELGDASYRSVPNIKLNNQKQIVPATIAPNTSMKKSISK